MLSNIRNDFEKSLYIAKTKEINEIFVKQAILPKDARINKEIILKLEELYQYLENEILKYDEIQSH